MSLLHVMVGWDYSGTSTEGLEVSLGLSTILGAVCV